MKWILYISIFSLFTMSNLLADSDQQINLEAQERVDALKLKAHGGDAESQYILASLYSSGKGVSQNKEESAKWCHRAAAQGHSGAQYELGIKYESGDGVQQNYKEAMNWYLKAAVNGYVKAAHNIGIMYREGLGVPKNDAEAVNWYRKAANQGDDFAQNNLAFMYYKGLGAPQDLIQAYMWARMATQTGNDPMYAQNLEYYASQMTSSEIAKAEMLANERLIESLKINVTP